MLCYSLALIMVIILHKTSKRGSSVFFMEQYFSPCTIKEQNSKAVDDLQYSKEACVASGKEYIAQVAV